MAKKYHVESLGQSNEDALDQWCRTRILNIRLSKNYHPTTLVWKMPSSWHCTGYSRGYTCSYTYIQYVRESVMLRSEMVQAEQ